MGKMVQEQNSEIVFKKKLARLLHAKSMTAAELSRRSGVAKQTISDWLGGAPPRNLTALRSVARVFETTIESLVFDEDISKICGYQSKHCVPREASERWNLDSNPGLDQELIAVSESGIVRFVSRILHEILGEQNISLRGRSIFEFIHIDDLPSVVNSGNGGLKYHRRAKCELRVLNMRGEILQAKHRTLILGRSQVAVHYFSEVKRESPSLPAQDLFDVSGLVKSVEPYFSLATNTSINVSIPNSTRDSIFACSVRPLFARLLLALVHDLRTPGLVSTIFRSKFWGGISIIVFAWEDSRLSPRKGTHELLRSVGPSS